MRPHGLYHTRFLCPLPPRVCSDSRPLSRWCYLTISSSPSSFLIEIRQTLKKKKLPSSCASLLFLIFVSQAERTSRWHLSRICCFACRVNCCFKIGSHTQSVCHSPRSVQSLPAFVSWFVPLIVISNEHFLINPELVLSFSWSWVFEKVGILEFEKVKSILGKETFRIHVWIIGNKSSEVNKI